MAHTTQYWPNASNIIINHPTITQIDGYPLPSSSIREGLKLLLSNISSGAFHDAAERGDPPKCHPETRVVIREEIMEWINSSGAMGKLILWIYGPAGSGKTAIGQSIAEECQKKGLLAASFFFGRTAVGRNDTTRVVATIAYQISRFLPQIEHQLFTAIEQDPTIFSRALATQIQVLIVKPLKSVEETLAVPIFVILDGLDESGPSPQAQGDLLNAIGSATMELQQIPLICLIASRPEFEIREAFSGPLLHSLMRPLELDNRYKPAADIKLYFDSSFRQIRDKYLRLGIRLSSPWPSASDVNRLVSKASGQFIFAATVVKFVDSVRHKPEERLNIILGLAAAVDETPFALLDALYRHILSSVTDLAQVLEILTLLLLAPTNQSFFYTPPMLTVGLIGELLGIDVQRILVDMHALLFVPPHMDRRSSPVRIHHASFSDFLTDRSRSLEFYIDKTQGHITLSRRWLKAIGNHQISTKYSFSGCVATFNIHCKDSPVSSEIADDLVEFRFRLKPILEEMVPKFRSEIMKTEWTEFFDCVKRQATQKKVLVYIKQRVSNISYATSYMAAYAGQFGDRVDVFAHLRREFIGIFIERIAQYPPALRSFIPTTLATPNDQGTFPIFPILLHSVCQSQREIDKTRELDSTLLDLSNYHSTNLIFYRLFEDRSLAGDYWVNSKSYLTLAKQISSVLFLKPTVSVPYFDFRYKNDWFFTILDKAAIDIALARFLLDHVVQYTDKTKYGHSFALASLRYVHKCGLPYLKHTHLESTDQCIICRKYDAASVVMGSHLPRSQPYPNNAFDNLRFFTRRRIRSIQKLLGRDPDPIFYLEY